MERRKETFMQWSSIFHQTRCDIRQWSLSSEEGREDSVSGNWVATDGHDDWLPTRLTPKKPQSKEGLFYRLTTPACQFYLADCLKNHEYVTPRPEEKYTRAGIRDWRTSSSFRSFCVSTPFICKECDSKTMCIHISTLILINKCVFLLKKWVYWVVLPLLSFRSSWNGWGYSSDLSVSLVLSIVL